MSNKLYASHEKTVRSLKNQLEQTRSKSCATLCDIQTVLIWHQNRERPETYYFNKVKRTKLYQNHGGEYCALLELL